jgi:hypothetical protein
MWTLSRQRVSPRPRARTRGPSHSLVVGYLAETSPHLARDTGWLSASILLREPAEKCVDIDKETTADFDDRALQPICLAVKEQPPQATLRERGVLLAELLDRQQFRA